MRGTRVVPLGWKSIEEIQRNLQFWRHERDIRHRSKCHHRPADRRENSRCVTLCNIRFCQASIIKDVARLRRRISVVAEKSIDDSFLPFPLFRRLSATKSSQARIDCPRPEEIDVVKKTEDAERFAIRVRRCRHPRHLFG